jgi:hypothetical protein
MSQEQCGHTQGDDTHCSGCGHTWKEIYAGTRAEYQRILKKLHDDLDFLRTGYRTAYASMRDMRYGLRDARRELVAVRQAMKRFEKFDATWPERGIPI